jgi:hypothetical protein
MRDRWDRMAEESERIEELVVEKTAEALDLRK